MTEVAERVRDYQCRVCLGVNHNITSQAILSTKFTVSSSNPSCFTKTVQDLQNTFTLYLNLTGSWVQTLFMQPPVLVRIYQRVLLHFCILIQPISLLSQSCTHIRFFFVNIIDSLLSKPSTSILAMYRSVKWA